MKFMKSSGAGVMALLIALGLAPLAGSVRAEQPALQASHEQTKAIEEWTWTLAEALKDRATFQGPPGVFPAGGK